MSGQRNVWILNGMRTPFGSFGGSLATVRATQLGVIAAKAALEKANVEPQDVDNVVFGSVIQTDGGSAYLARHIGLDVGVKQTVPALTVNRLCGSGLQAVVSAAASIQLGESEVALCGGAESMSQSPYVLRQARFGYRMGDAKAVDMLSEILTDCRGDLPMGITAENLAEDYGITRAEQDEFALLSQARAAQAQASGRLAQEIVGVPVHTRKGEMIVDQDEHIRPDTTLEALGKLRPAFRTDGTVTAGNASGINDGAAALLIASDTAVDAHGYQPLARLVSTAVVGVDPSRMGIGPVPAIQLALERAEWSLSDVDLFEVNEAFAAQYLAVEKALQLPRDKTNVNGGAIALGHPVGASGARVLLTLIRELQLRGLKRGVASLCIGGGQGIAVTVERV
ncbi:acetyl-CoA C-acetyltransferase [Alicyclobacillus tolerans]|uniref:acetyl-CoA C-acetyltransferase n=1 Tax=Alicyclobacillus tolerans TaxID=90970 RepID=A0A1M6K3F9_9BACL|nr:acetyl-CoA C-acetyltransferase [Alicyclobacillus montanus]SHJ53499.1 acetyl-CoA C-acetyltransferase/acetyl-CoA acyltransferase 2 [Alicyclobacillus montanus]